MKVYIDLDRTLFDTDRFLNDLYKMLNDKIDLDLFNKYQEDNKKGGFNPYKILKLMNVRKDIIASLDEFMNNIKKYVYSDVSFFFNMLHSKGYTIILLTKGDKRFQKMKLKKSELLFDEKIFTLEFKGDLNLDYQNSLFIDDNPYELDDIYLNNPKRIIRIKRENAKYNNILTKNKIEEVNNLKEINL